MKDDYPKYIEFLFTNKKKNNNPVGTWSICMNK